MSESKTRSLNNHIITMQENKSISSLSSGEEAGLSVLPISKLESSLSLSSSVKLDQANVSSTTLFELDKAARNSSEREKNFTCNNILSSTDHPFTINQKSSYISYFYTNTNTILNKFVMSYEEQLHKAISKGNYELCKELLLKNCDVNAEFNKKYPLCLACEHNYYEIAELLIKHGANVNQFDYYDQSCLIYAAGMADLNVVELLVNNGADVNRCDSNGNYPLHVAITRQNDEICDYLLDQGAKIDIFDKQGCTPLAMAISHEHLHMINKLLTLGADPNISDNNGDTPLIKAIWATINASVEYDEIFKIVKRLIELGADVNAKNETGRTALFTAIYQNNTDLSLYLIDKGADCQLEDMGLSYFTLLHYACFQGNYSIAKALLEHNCDPNSIASSCESPVYIAVTRGYLDIIGLLVEYGADVNLYIGSDLDNKCTALQASVYYISDYIHFKEIVNKLIEGNVDLSVSQPGPILYICLQYNKVDFAKYLLSVGSDVKKRTVFNQSCFYKAFLTKNYEFMQMCILAGFNIYEEAWINNYLENPDFIEYTDYYVRKRTSSSNNLNSETNSDNDDDNNNDDNNNKNTNNTDEYEIAESNEIMRKSDQEIAELLNLDEYFFERFHINNNKKTNNKNSKNEKSKNSEIAKKIYMLIKYYYTNPLSLKDLARIQIRKSLLNVNNKMKLKVENDLPLPKRLKDYLLFKEFNL